MLTAASSRPSQHGFTAVARTAPRYAEWQGVLNVTLENFLRDVEEDVFRDFKLVAMLMKKGNVKYGMSGNDLRWRIRYRQPPLIGIADADTLTFARQDRHKQAFIDWRGYAMTDAVTFKEREMNKGKEAIVNRFEELATLMMEDVTERFGYEPYINGYATGNTKRFHGMESFLGTTGSAVSGSVAMAPSQSYAGLSTALANYGGTWTGSWPRGFGTADYDFYSPLILDYTSTLATGSGGWSSATTTWAARCLEVLRFGIIFSQKNKSKKGMLDFIDLDREMHRLAKEALHQSERIMVERSGDEGLVSMGFRDVFNYDGCEVTTEYGLPVGTGYGFNCNHVDINCLTKQMWQSRGPDEDLASMAYRFLIYNFGNFRWRPRYFLKIGAFQTNGA